MKAAFDMVDTDNNGFLDAAEIKAMLGGLEPDNENAISDADV